MQSKYQGNKQEPKCNTPGGIIQSVQGIIKPANMVFRVRHKNHTMEWNTEQQLRFNVQSVKVLEQRF